MRGFESFAEVLQQGRKYRRNNPPTAKEIEDAKRLFPGSQLGKKG